MREGHDGVGAGDLLGGRYRLERLAGRGGMAEVWAARDERLGRRVAVKVAALGAAEVPDLRGRFAQEVRLQAGLQHAALVALLDAGDASADLPWFVLEWVGGGHLAARARGVAWTPSATAAVGRRIAEGLAHLHAEGLVHLDLKPTNVLLTEAGEAKIADFGIACPAGRRDELVAEGRILGTAAYLAPEQFAGAPLTAAVDVHALGLMLVELLTGDRPRSTPPSTPPSARRPAERLPRPPLPVSLGAGWLRLLAEMTALEPGDRPSADAVAMRLGTLAGPGATQIGRAHV